MVSFLQVFKPSCPESITRMVFGEYTQTNKNPSAWYFVRPAQAVTYGTVAIIIRVVFLTPYLRIRGVSQSSINYNQSHHVYINRKQQYNCLIWQDLPNNSLCSTGLWRCASLATALNALLCTFRSLVVMNAITGKLRFVLPGSSVGRYKWTHDWHV